MKITDQILKRIVAGSQKERPTGKCLDEETLAAIAERNLGKEETDSAFNHLTKCSRCLDSLHILKLTLNESQEEALFRVPEKALSRARKLDPANNSIVEVIVKFAKGVAELTRLNGDIDYGMTPVADALRGHEQVISESLVTLHKEFPPYQTEVDIEKIHDDRGEITVTMKDTESGLPASGVRVSLFDNKLELESSMLEDGSTVFENIKFGKYRVEITKVGKPLGIIALEMKGEEK
jgi:hypothetical protein